jgi:LysM repeat protein
MGQLEKYGLYVLCLVIFLILGVTIWGGGDLPQRAPAARPGSDLQVRPTAKPEPGKSDPAAATPLAPDLEALLRPADRRQEPKAPEPKTPPAKAAAGQPQDASADRAPADGAAPVAEGVRPVHKIERGDSFESIARKLLGSAALQGEIARLNPRVEPRRLRIGQEILLPTKQEAQRLLAGEAAPTKAEPAGAPAPKAAEAKGSASTHTVAKGDTFEGIARRLLGSGKRVDELRELNPDVDPTRLKVGQKIQLPKK